MHRIRRLALWCALLAAFPALAREAPAAEGAAPAGDVVSLRFAWPAPARARVSYRRTRNRTGERPKVFTARYETRAERGEDGFRISTRGTSWRGDLPFPRALARDAIRASEGVVQLVGEEGKFAGLEGAEELRPVLAQVFEDAKVPAEEARRVVAVAEAAMRGEAEELWNLAVGFWTGADLVIGATYALESDAEIPLVAGLRARHAIEFSVSRRVPCAAGERAPRCVEATLRSTPDHAALERAAESLVVRFAPGSEEPVAELAKEISAESELVLVTDPATLLPRRVVWTKAVRIGGGESGPARAEQSDRSEYDYRWLPAEPPRKIQPPRRVAPSPAQAAASVAPAAEARAP
jgi:hypothetical protein